MNIDRTAKVLMASIALFLGIIAFRMNLDSAQAQDTAQGQDITPSKYDNLEVLGSGSSPVGNGYVLTTMFLNKKTGSVNLVLFDASSMKQPVTSVMPIAPILRLDERGELVIGQFSQLPPPKAVA